MRPSTARFFASLAAIFQPPFNGLWLVALLYYIWCYVVFPHSQPLRGNFPDPDDYMYLVQVMDWLKGAGWYDNIQHRINPPDGIMIHFSRLAMVPMAVLTLLFEKLFGLGPRGGAMLMALTYPLILLGCFFVVMRSLTARLMPGEWAGIAPVIALFSPSLMYMFQPGHIDHHGLMILIVALVMDYALRMMQEPEKIRWGIGAGLALAFGLVIALEILPWLLIVAGGLGLWAIVRGRAAARNSLVFALTLHAASILFLLVTRRPEAFFTADVLTYSVVYVYLTGGIAVSFAAVALAAELGMTWRAVLGVAFGGLCGFLFLTRFPTLIDGPYGAMDPELQDLILDDVSEAMPLYRKLFDPVILVLYISSNLLALGSCAVFLKQAKKQERWPWALLFVMLAASFLLSVFYQCRYAGTMGMLTVVPLAVLLQRGWGWLRTHAAGRKKIYAEIGLLLLVGPLLAVLLPALADGRSFNRGVVLFPVVGNDPNPCDMWVLEQALRDSLTLGKQPHLIISDMALGPEILYRTSHSVLAAPFFDTEGNMDAYRFFSTLYPQEAEAIARRRHADLVVVCKFIPASYLRTTISKANSVTSKDFAPHLIESLVIGRPPTWLQPVKVPSLRNYMIYQVKPPGKADGDATKLSVKP